MKFIKKAKLVHGNRYDYQLVNYVNSYSKVKIICTKHGVFLQTPNNHLAGHGCPKCSKFTNNKLIQEEKFIQKAIKVHGNKYDYSRINYVNSKTKVKIICPEHGVFWQQPRHHVSGHGCSKCRKSQWNFDYFLVKCKKVHNEKYDYSKVQYNGFKEKIKIICPIHGCFLQTVKAHMNGQGCPQCGRNATSKANLSNINDFISKAQKIHDDKYDYSKAKYLDSRTKVTITCPVHGDFSQDPITHLRGSGCRKCSGEWDKDIFIAKANVVHNGRYNYSNVDYGNANTEVKIICPTHGLFWQRPSNHIYGSGCPKCSLTTVQHQVLSFVEQYAEAKSNDRSIISPYELDIYISFYNLAIEVNGIYWHSFNYRADKEEKNKHLDKHKMCLSKNIGLLQIWDEEWNNKRCIIESMIKNKLKLSERIYARKCDFRTINHKIFSNFLIDNHLQGQVPTKYKYALYYKGEIVQVLGINTHPKYNYEISRLATKCNCSVVGGFTKLLQNSIKLLRINSIMTFANKRYSNGDVYKKSGFKLINQTRPNYFYVKDHHIYSRIKFQKHKLSKVLSDFDPSISEVDNMLNHGYRQLWDAGNYQYLLTMP